MCLIELVISFDPVYGKRDLSFDNKTESGGAESCQQNEGTGDDIDEPSAVIQLKGKVGKMRR